MINIAFVRAFLWLIKYVNPAPLILTVLCSLVAVQELGVDSDVTLAFGISTFLLISLQLLSLGGRDNEVGTDKKFHAFSYSFLWLVYTIIGSLPFVFSSDALGLGDFTRGFFEAMSGYTSTGMTMVDTPHLLPACIQLYRSGLQWIGGIGFMVFVLVILHKRNRPETLFSVSGLDGTHHLDIQFVIRSFGIVYLGIPILALAGLLLSDVPAWEAVNHALTLASTGGFSVTPDGFSSYSSALLVFCMIVMLIAAVPLPLIALVCRGKFKEVGRDSELRAFLVWFIAATFLLMAYSDVSIKHLFNGISAITTAGFAATSLEEYSLAPIHLITILMVVGGCSNSTAGGVKLDRLLWSVKGIYHFMFKRSLSGVTYNRRVIQYDTANREIKLAALFILTAVIVRKLATYAFFLLEPGNSITKIEFDVASAIATTGLSAGFLSSDLSSPSIWIFSVLMWIGRVEFLVFAMFIYFIGSRISVRPDKR